jgi:hypothetical protein
MKRVSSRPVKGATLARLSSRHWVVGIEAGWSLADALADEQGNPDDVTP